MQQYVLLYGYEENTLKRLVIFLTAGFVLVMHTVTRIETLEKVEIRVSSARRRKPS